MVQPGRSATLLETHELISSALNFKLGSAFSNPSRVYNRGKIPGKSCVITRHSIQSREIRNMIPNNVHFPVNLWSICKPLRALVTHHELVENFLGEILCNRCEVG